jgi:hypothetical protein
VGPCSRYWYCPGRAEPVKAVCDRRATTSVNLLGERTREDDLDGTCPTVPESAAIGSMGTSGQDGAGRLTLKGQVVKHTHPYQNFPSGVV